MKAAIIGLPRSGKSTLFSAVTGTTVDPYAPPEPRRAVAHVPDARVDHLAGLCNPKKIVYESIELVDIPGASLDNQAGQAEWRKLVPAVRQADALVLVVRDFENAAVPAYRDRIDPQAEAAEMWDELIFADLEQVANRLDKLEKALKKPTKTHDQEKREQGLLIRCREALDSGIPLSTVVNTEDERRLVASFTFLTQRPIVMVRNTSDDQVAGTEPIRHEHARESLVLCAAIEAEIAALDAADRAAFLADLNLSEPARDRLIRACYAACGLISFLTMGPDECRAWAVRKGSTAQEAAGKIHSDLARGFVRAETVSFDDLSICGDMRGAKAAGKVRKEGKTYIVQDGDILNILAST